jgi:RHS repeat-associated protein
MPFDAASRLLSVSDGVNAATYSYLANSPLVGQITFAHSGANAMTTAKQYDYLNRLTSTATSSNSFAYQYNAANQRTQTAMSDGSYWLYAYDSLGQVTFANKYWSDLTPVAGQQFGYSFDKMGNRTQTLAGGDQNGANLRVASYSANTLNQIANRAVPAFVDVMGDGLATNAVTVNGATAYRKNEYFRQQLSVTNSSAVWQTLAVAAPGTVTNTGHIYVPQNPEAYTYDADGNLLSDGRWTNTWDAENRLVAMTSLSGAPSGSQSQLIFTYDYQGRRIEKIATTNNSGIYYTNVFTYDGWNCVASLGPSLNLSNSFLWGSDLSGSMQGAGGVGGLVEVTYYGPGGTTNTFPAFDGNGNVSALFNAANGGTLANYEYGPFGELIRATGPMARLNPFRFSAKYDDDESDFLYYGCRYYNPSTGRWINRDPIGEKGGLNLYAFVGNDSIDHYDAFGLMTYQQMTAIFQRLKQEMEAQHIPCCCKPVVVQSANLQSLAVSGTTATVGVLTTLSKGDCTCDIIGYYWWNCFRAHNEAVKAGVPITGLNDTDWTNYGWQSGNDTDTETAVGTSSPYDPFDAHHWGWMAQVLYTYCDANRHIMSIDWRPAPEKQYTWSALHQTWTDFQ